MFSFQITPRFGDIDGLGHVNNNVVPTWFETARNPFFRYFNKDLDLKQWNLILARFEVDFLNQMYYGRDVEIRSWVTRLGRSSFEIYQEAWQDDKIGAKGKAVLVHFDFAEQKSVPVPGDIKKELEKHFLETKNS
ncbi:MAG TPA: thioesterase family protein [Bacteroidales bacterium]|nr:thioesterase family protein [Bacteroidales bacterium]